MERKRVLITGITGQDGSYLAEFLLEKGYEVHGLMRRTSNDGLERVRNLLRREDFHLHYGDLIDGHSLSIVAEKSKPDEVYNLAAQSDVRISFDQPYLTREVNFFGVMRLIDALMKHNPKVKFYQASTSELFGNTTTMPQNEETPMNPVSPYSKAKLEAHRFVGNLRREGFFGACGILFNHESPRRGENFVTRKIIKEAVEIARGKRETIMLGNLDARRDWGYAPDYVEAMWLMLQQDKPDDFVIATGETHSIKDLLNEAFSRTGLNWEKHVIMDYELKRPKEVHELRGDYSKAERFLGWKPRTNFKELIGIIFDAEMKNAQNNPAV